MLHHLSGCFSSRIQSWRSSMKSKTVPIRTAALWLLQPKKNAYLPIVSLRCGWVTEVMRWNSSFCGRQTCMGLTTNNIPDEFCHTEWVFLICIISTYWTLFWGKKQTIYWCTSSVHCKQGWINLLWVLAAKYPTPPTTTHTHTFFPEPILPRATDSGIIWNNTLPDVCCQLVGLQ